MRAIHSSTYKVALWIALGPLSYFMDGPFAIKNLHHEHTPTEALIMTLIVWPIGCWYVQRDWRELRTSLGELVLWRIKPRWTWWAVIPLVAWLALILAYAATNPVNAIGLAISLVIVGVLYLRMAQACLREQEAEREAAKRASAFLPFLGT